MIDRSRTEVDGVTKVCLGCGVPKELEEFYYNPTGKFKRAARCKDCYKKYNEVQYRNDPSKQNERTKNWLKLHPDASRRSSSIRRTRKKLAEGTHTWRQFLNLCISSEWKCFYCGSGLDLDTVTEDHVIALSRGGSDDISNIVPSCKVCNFKKGIK